jgi:hypothetical protein
MWVSTISILNVHYFVAITLLLLIQDTQHILPPVAVIRANNEFSNKARAEPLEKIQYGNGKVQLNFGGLTYLVAKSGCSR